MVRNANDEGFGSGTKSPPLLLHCSAGCGRTGVFALVDTLIHRIRARDSNLDVIQVLNNLRMGRMGLIQTPNQLRFCFLAIAHALADEITHTNEMLSVAASVMVSQAPDPKLSGFPGELKESKHEVQSEPGGAFTRKLSTWLIFYIRIACLVTAFGIYLIPAQQDLFMCNMLDAGLDPQSFASASLFFCVSGTSLLIVTAAAIRGPEILLRKRIRVGLSAAIVLQDFGMATLAGISLLVGSGSSSVEVVAVLAATFSLIGRGALK